MSSTGYTGLAAGKRLGCGESSSLNAFMLSLSGEIRTTALEGTGDWLI